MTSTCGTSMLVTTSRLSWTGIWRRTSLECSTRTIISSRGRSCV
uniref:Uncharacterized protein n=1 Tax=Anguilla anguilla TaxID=7936 RepID=A0A0E9W225_ANGAN